MQYVLSEAHTCLGRPGLDLNTYNSLETVYSLLCTQILLFSSVEALFLAFMIL